MAILVDECRKAFTAIAEHLNDSVLICDDAALCTITSSIGIAALVSHFKIANCLRLEVPRTGQDWRIPSLSTFADDFVTSSKERPAVFLLTRPLVEVSSVIVSLVQFHRLTAARLCISLPETGLAVAQAGSSITSLAASLRDSCPGVNISIAPLNIAYSVFAPNCLLVPAARSAFPTLPNLICGDTRDAAELALLRPHVASKEPARRGTDLALLPHHLLAVCQQLKVRPQVFSLGSSAQHTAETLAALWTASSSSSSASSSLRSCSVVLVDRTLDLVGPLSHPEEATLALRGSALDTVLALSHTPSHSGLCDAVYPPVSSNAATPELKAQKQSGKEEKHSSGQHPHGPEHPGVLHGLVSGGSASDKETALARHALVTQPTRTALATLRKLVLAVLAQESKAVPATTAAKTTSAGSAKLTELATLLSAMRDDPAVLARHPALYQLVDWVVATLQRVPDTWDKLASVERTLELTLSAGDTASPLASLTEMVSSGLPLSDALQLALFTYSLLGPNGYSSGDEKPLLEALVAAVLRSSSSSSPSDRDRAMRVVARLSDRLRAVADARQDLTTAELAILFQPPSSPGAGSEVLGYSSFLGRLLARLLNSEQETDDLAFHSGDSLSLKKITDTVASSVKESLSSLSSLGSFFRSSVTQSLGLSGQQPTSEPRPDSSDLMLLFVIGGITAAEIRELSDLGAAQPRLQVLLGSTEVTTPQRLMQHVFTDDHASEP